MKRVFILLFIVLTITACHQDTDLIIPHPYVPAQNIVSSVGGIIVDEENNPVADATVVLGTETKETDKNGVFIFRNVEVNSDRAYIKVVKAGYFHGSRTILPRKDAISRVRIKLLSSMEIGMVAASMGGEFTLPGGAALLFPANAIIDQAGNTYNADVHISLKHITPLDRDLSIKMPSHLFGKSSDGENKALTSLGMMAISLTDDNGAELKIANGYQVEIHFPIPDILFSSAPATTPLWQFDEEEGYWREEGSASLNNNVYVGKISDFSFWNVGIPYELIEISGKVIDQNGEPLPYIQISYTSLDNTSMGAVWTDNTGYFTGKVPAGEILKIETLDKCGVTIQTDEVGPFSSTSNLVNVSLNDSNVNLATVAGRLVGCNEAAVSNGYVLIQSGEIYDAYYSVSTGEFSASFLSCSGVGEVTVSGVNIDNANESIPMNFDVNSTINAGAIQVCE